MNINTKSTFITGVLCLCQAAALGQNLLVNGSFEAGNTGFTGDYTFASTGSGSGHYDIVRNPRDSHGGGASFGDHTSGTGLMLVANGASDTNRAFWRQTVSVTTNTTYEFSGWGAAWGNDGSGHDPVPSSIRVSINGKPVGPTIQLSNLDGDWRAFSVRWGSSTSATAVAELRLETSADYGNDPAFDDFQFTVFQPQLTIRVATVEICWPSEAGVNYQVEYESALTGHLWTPFGTVVRGSGTNNCVVDAVTTPGRFYRVREVP